MLDVAARRADGGTDVNRPFPSGLVGGAADGHAAYMNEFEFSLFERSDFIGFFKTFENCLKHRHNSLATRDPGRLIAPHSPIQARDTETVWRPGHLAKPRLMHAAQHFIGRRKAFNGRRQISIRAAHSRKQRADRGQDFLEIDAIPVPKQAARFSEIEDPAFSTGSEYTRDLPQSGVVIS